MRYITSLDEFKQNINLEKPLCIHFTSKGSMMCPIYGPYFEKQAEFKTDLECVKVDIDDCKDIKEFAGVTGVPNFIVFKNGKEVHRVTGADEEALKELFAKQF